MKKAAIWVVILGVFGFILYDFASSSQKEQALVEEASQPIPVDEEEAVDVPDEYQKTQAQQLSLAQVKEIPHMIFI